VKGGEGRKVGSRLGRKRGGRGKGKTCRREVWQMLTERTHKTEGKTGKGDVKSHLKKRGRGLAGRSGFSQGGT